MNKATKTITIKTTVKEAMTLPCPVKELDWIPEWSYEMIYSKSGVNEVGCIFDETMSAPVLFEKEMTTRWHTVILNDNKFVALIAAEGIGAVRFEWSVKEVAEGIEATWTMAFSPYQDTTEDISDKMAVAIEFLSSCGKHYLETGKMIG